MKKTLWIRLMLMGVLLWSCSPTKYLKEGEYLLQRNEIHVQDKVVDKADLAAYCKQKPNRSILGFPVYVALYNMVDPAKEKMREAKRQAKERKRNKKRIAEGKAPKKRHPFYLKRWWREQIGEPPVIYQSYLNKQSRKNLSAYMHNKGYYDAQVSDTVKYRKRRRRAIVNYHIAPQTAYTIRAIQSVMPDKRIDTLVAKMPEWQALDSGQLFNAFAMDALRYKISAKLQNHGYHGFGPGQVVFYADSNRRTHSVAVEMKILTASDSGYVALQEPLPVSRISKVQVLSYPYTLHQLNTRQMHTLYHGTDSVPYMYYDSLTFIPRVFQRRLELHKGDVFSKDKMKRTALYINRLGIFRSVNIKLREDTTNLLSDRVDIPLVAEIQLMPSSKQMYSVEMEGYTSAGILGTALKFTYGHKNLFRRAISLRLEFNGKVERSASQLASTGQNLYAYEYGAYAALRFPSFFSPFRMRQFNKRYFPGTNISVDYNFKNRFEYVRETSSLGFGYSWSTPKGFKHYLNPVDFYLTRFNDIKSSYLDYLIAKELMSRYFDHVIPAGNYSVFYTNKKSEAATNFFSVNFRVELAGNLLYLLQSQLDTPKKGEGDLNRKLNKAYIYARYAPGLREILLDSVTKALNINNSRHYTFNGTLYHQYVKSDIDFRYYWSWGKHIGLAGRFFAGVIYSYGNTKFAPIEKQYFVGGSNDLRAWWVRSLGPGAYVFDKSTNSLNRYYQSGDIKLLGSLELRHDLVWLIKGALFADIGNVWDLEENASFPQGQFRGDTFYKQIALGLGYGLRFDLSFFVLRFDLAFKLRDPSMPSRNKWVYAQGDNSYKRPVLNFGIGYPF